MDTEEKKDNPGDFGKVIDALHSRQKLPSLRSYQGDMAEFIKNKDQSVASIVLKEKEKERKEEKLIPPIVKKESKNNFSANLVAALAALILLVGGGMVVLYTIGFLGGKEVEEVVIEQKIIPYNNSVILANATLSNLGTELLKIPNQNGISAVTITDASGQTIGSAREFFNFLKISPPAALMRTLEDEYMIGLFSQEGVSLPFLIIKVSDFGNSFSAMLDWETNLLSDLSFFDAEIVQNSDYVTLSPLEDVYQWKDIIVKNKDTRGYANRKNEAKIAYTFLDKNTILIATNISTIGSISTSFASRSIVR